MRVERLPVAALLVLVLGGCENGHGDLREYVERVKARPAGGIDPIPPIAEPESFEYNDDDLRDPFRSAAVAQGGDDQGSGPRPDPDRRAEYLEGFPLDSLEMVGTLSREGKTWALIKDNDGVVHRVAVDNYMGRNHGRVVSISQQKVQLIELVPDGAGGWREREAEIKLDEAEF